MKNDAEKDLNDAMAAISLTTNTLQLAGVHKLAIAAALFNQAGVLWRSVFPNEAELRPVVMHAAEITITGVPQPPPIMPKGY